MDGAQAAADAARGRAPKPEKPLSDAAVSLTDFMDTDFPPRLWLIKDWLPEQGTALLYGYRGTGKSWIAMSAALAVARGEKFVLWDGPKEPKHSLYVQAEMPQVEDQDRLKLLMDGRPPPEKFTYLSYQKMRELGMPAFKIDQPGPQAAFHKFLENLKEETGDQCITIFLDTYSALTSIGFDPNSAADVRPVAQFLTDLKLDGHSVMLLHHTGKDRVSQRGSSLLEDQLDTSILLYREPNCKSRDAEFKVLFPKTRKRGPAERDPILTLCPQADGSLGWTTKPAEKQKFEGLLRAGRNGETTKNVELEAILNMPRATVGRLVRSAKNQKLLANTPELTLTDKGRALVPTAEEQAAIPF